MTERLFVTTIQLVIESESSNLAADAVKNILSDYEMADGTLKDWYYLKVGQHRLTPTRDYGLEAERARQQVWATCVNHP